MLESEETSKERHEETQQKQQPGRQGAPSESRGACGTSADEIPGEPVVRWEAHIPSRISSGRAHLLPIILFYFLRAMAKYQ